MVTLKERTFGKKERARLLNPNKVLSYPKPLISEGLSSFLANLHNQSKTIDSHNLDIPDEFIQELKTIGIDIHERRRSRQAELEAVAKRVSIGGVTKDRDGI